MAKKVVFYFCLILISVTGFSQGSYNDCAERGKDIYNQKMKLLQEKNTAVNQIMMGEFCSKCNKCKDEFPSSSAFYQHVKDVEGVVTYKDKMVAKQNKEKEYDDKIANINNAIADNQKECDELYKQWQKQRQEEVQAATNKANDEINSVNDERDARLNEIDDLNVPSTLNNGSDVAKNLPSQTTQNAISDVYGGVNTDKYKTDETEGSDNFAFDDATDKESYLDQILQKISNGANYIESGIDNAGQQLQNGIDYIKESTGIDVVAKSGEVIVDKINEAIATNIPSIQTINENFIQPLKSTPILGVVSFYNKMKELPATYNEAYDLLREKGVPYFAGENNDFPSDWNKFINKTAKQYGGGF